jgi:tetratricopeptide (TPR) repeat protein
MRSLVRLLSTVLFLLPALIGTSHAQCLDKPTARVDATRLQAARQDELRGRWDQALQRFQSAHELSPVEQAARVRILVERHLAFRLDRDNTLSIAEQALERARQACDKAAIASVQHSIGRIHYWDAFANGDFERSRPYFAAALELRTQLSDKPGMADSGFYLGLIEQMQERNDAAMTRFRQSLAWSREADDKLLQSFAIRHIAGLDEDAGKLADSERGFRESLALREQAGADFLVPFARLTLADFIEQRHGNHAEALKMTEQAVQEARQSSSRRALVIGEMSLSQRLHKAGRSQLALAHAESARKEAERLGDAELLADARKQLAQAQQTNSRE